jgi:hypothetical protein
MKSIATSLVFLLLCGLAYSQTIDQKLLVIRNDGTIGGQLIVAYQVKGTGLSASNTLGSATTDVLFDNTKLTFLSAANWGFGFAQGYTSQVTNHATSLRIGVIGGGVFPGGGIGFDINGTYNTWVQLTFTILDPTVAPSLSLAPASNSIGLYKNHSNNPQTNIITNQTLSPLVLSVRSTISGNVGIAGAVLNYNDGGSLNVVADGTGAYSFTVPYGWSGFVLPALAGYTFTPQNIIYTNVKADKTNQNYLSAVTLPVTIDQQLLVVRNDGNVGGQLTVAYQVKGTNLTPSNSLGSATTDVLFDNTKISYLNATGWGFGFLQGYVAQVTNNSTFVRIGVINSGVFPGGAAGIDLSSAYSNWVMLNFTILDTSIAPSLSISTTTNAIGLFQFHSNIPQTNMVINQPLSVPLFTIMSNITGNAGAPGVTLSYLDGTLKNIVADSIGAYSIIVPYNWSGTVTPSSAGLTFSPVSRNYSNLKSDINTQNYSAFPSLSLNLTALFEAMYVAGGTAMPNPAPVTVSLYNASTFALVESKTGTLDVNGVGSFLFTSAVNGTSYFIQVKSPTSLETWSATGVSFTGGALSYNFTTALAQAYTDGSLPPQSLQGSKYCIYSGYVNHDGFITNDDFTGVDNDASVGDWHVENDVNGDGFVTNDDFTFIDNNASVGLARQVPPGAPSHLATRPVKNHVQRSSVN